MSEDTFNEAVRAVESAFGTKQNKIDWRPATLGDGRGTVSTGNNMVYCRLTENSSVIEVLNLRVAPVDGLRVRIAKTPEMPLVWQVIGQDDQRTDENGNNGGGVSYNVGPHHRLHEYLGVDQVNVDWRQITNLRVYAAGSMVIGVLAGLIPRPGSDLVVPTQTYDLTAYVPASGALYALITIDTAGALAVTTGATVDSILSLTLADIPDTPDGHFRLAAVRLYFGQTAINESTVSNDIRDLRYPQERIAGEAGTIFGVQTANTIYAGPASGADALPTFRAGVTDDIASGVFPIARGGTNAATANDALNNLLPSQSGQAGNSLHTDGSNSYWGPGGGSEGTIVITSLPVGTITGYGGSSIPAGWLECNGAAVSRTTYADLFTAIGTTYGVGDGSTTFNLPDLRGRTGIGKGTGSGLTARSIGATGGTETHTLTTAEIPSHTHPITTLSTYGIGVVGPVVANTDVTGTVNTGSNAGGGGAHNNMQPFLVTAYIIKYTDTATSSLIFDDGATPENVTLTAATGDDVYAARRDHVHAIDQGIAPTWTATHSWTNDSDTAHAMYLYRGDDPTVHGPAFAGFRAYGTLASPSDAGINAVFARFSGRGRGSGAWPASATGRLDIAATEAQTSTAQGTDIRLYTTPNGSTTIGLAATFGQDKSLAVVGAISASNYAGTVSGGGAIATGGFTLTVPATGTAALLATANVFTANQTISNTAPALAFTDTTVSAKSLTVAIDSNLAQFRESSAAANSLLVLDLANNRVGIGAAPISSPNLALDVHINAATFPNSTVAQFINDNTSDGNMNVVFAGYSSNTNTAFGVNRAGASFIIYNKNSTDGNYNGFSFWNALGLQTSAVLGINVSQGGSGVAQGALQFITRNTAGLNNTLYLSKDGNVGVMNTAPSTRLHVTLDNATTNAVDEMFRISHNSTGTAAAGFGGAIALNLESSTTADQAAAAIDWLWTDATHASRTALYRGTTTGNATNTGYYGHWNHSAVAGSAITVIPNATGDVTEIATFVYAVAEVTGTGTGGGTVTVTPGGGAVTLYSDGTDTLQITCAADGSVTVQRSAGTDTFKVSLWGTWL